MRATLVDEWIMHLRLSYRSFKRDWIRYSIEHVLLGYFNSILKYRNMSNVIINDNNVHKQ